MIPPFPAMFAAFKKVSGCAFAFLGDNQAEFWRESGGILAASPAGSSDQRREIGGLFGVVAGKQVL
jgi:hypothetical protein